MDSKTSSTFGFLRRRASIFPQRSTGKKPKNGPSFSSNRLPPTLSSGVIVQEKDISHPELSRSLFSGTPVLPVGLDISDEETSLSDSGSESPVHVELPQQPNIYQHASGNVWAELSWTGPCSGELVSFYELQLEEAQTTGPSKKVRWVCLETEEHLENLSPGTKYLFRVRALNVAGPGKWSDPYKFATLPAIPGVPLDPSPIIAIVQRHKKTQKKTIFLPAS